MHMHKVRGQHEILLHDHVDNNLKSEGQHSWKDPLNSCRSNATKFNRIIREKLNTPRLQQPGKAHLIKLA